MKLIMKLDKQVRYVRIISLLIKDNDMLKKKYEQICHKIRYKIAN